MKAWIDTFHYRCEWIGGCRDAATHAVFLGELGPFGKYCEHHANYVACSVNDNQKPASSEDSSS